MKQSVCLFSLAVLLISCLLLGSCGDNSRATALLSRADSLMADRPDSALQILDGCEAEVSAWPESQQMRYRLLQAKGRNKVECADTTAVDCDYVLLGRLHGQMATLLRRIQLPYETLEEANLAEIMSHKAGDNQMALDCKMLKAEAYFLMGETDSVISISENVSKRFSQCGDTIYSIIALKPAILGYIM